MTLEGEKKSHKARALNFKMFYGLTAVYRVEKDDAGIS